MRKIRSKRLYEYLLNRGVIEASDEVIQEAKKEYSRQYKKQWRLSRVKQREIRLSFTEKEYTQIQKLAKQARLKTTTFVTDFILSSIQNNPLRADRDALLKILQLVGMAINICKDNQEVKEYLLQAESLLLQYINYVNDTQDTPASSGNGF